MASSAPAHRTHPSAINQLRRLLAPVTRGDSPTIRQMSWFRGKLHGSIRLARVPIESRACHRRICPDTSPLLRRFSAENRTLATAADVAARRQGARGGRAAGVVLARSTVSFRSETARSRRIRERGIKICAALRERRRSRSSWSRRTEGSEPDRARAWPRRARSCPAVPRDTASFRCGTVALRRHSPSCPPSGCRRDR